ncbi:uncharacterized protein LOC143461559 [Clavelina lepadiformis]|uniref:uncharacterized protein LOC143461559 n=1 Tax=Clavelina lepadiformis TaxID=159417 RepID=UPI004042EA0D
MDSSEDDESTSNEYMDLGPITVIEADPTSSQPKATRNDEKHVMISYNWESQKLAKKVCKKLEKRGYKVWIDIKYMQKNIYDQMYQAVRNAYVVLIFVSKKYQESENCRREAFMAADLKIPIVPIYTEKSFEPEKLLKCVIAGKLYHDFSNEKDFDLKFPELCKAINSYHMYSDENAVVQATQKKNQVNILRRLFGIKSCSKLRRRMTALGFLLLLIIVAASVGSYFGYVAGILNPSNQTDASATPTVNASPESTTTTSSGIGEVQNATELAHTRSNTVTGLESTTPSPDLPRSCQDHYTSGSDTSGVYTIYPISDPIQVYCDQVRDGGGWTVIQRRLNGSLNFNRPWLDYRRGFGSASGEYWLGLDLISAITRAGFQELRIDFVKSLFSQHGYAKYSTFVVGHQSTEFAITSVGTFSGSSGIPNFMDHSLNTKFSTSDVENDMESSRNCAEIEEGGWWYRDCIFTSDSANLNGEYYFHFEIGSSILVSSEMKIRTSR